ncbi:hypothetical protein [Lentibacillus sp. Marseille-P4043]|uniref:hypothetical protein n=1 Tax=Lentibacillus sp. Marseille-P4043 TaxID=2040293 RepID=UPI00131A5FE5|nr:hypothetical protein [Lentibacillus sp. Marseille-P4043]
MLEPKRGNIIPKRKTSTQEEREHQPETQNIDPKRKTSTRNVKHRRETRNIDPRTRTSTRNERISTRNAKHRPETRKYRRECENIIPIKSPAESNSIVMSHFISIVQKTVFFTESQVCLSAIYRIKFNYFHKIWFI